MDTLIRFSCIILHPGLFPPFFTHPFNPPRTKVQIEITPEKLSVLSAPGWREARVIGNEPLVKFDHVTIQHLSANGRRLEILRHSLGRMALIGAIALAYFFLRYDLGLGLLGGLICAGVSGLLFFMVNGGLTVRHAAVRYYFDPRHDGKKFYLEIEPSQEQEVHQALLAAGLRIQESERIRKV